MRKIVLVGTMALCIASVMPAHAGTYSRSYTTGSTPRLSFKVNFSDEDLGQENPADYADSGLGLPTDKALRGTPADTRPFHGTPAEGRKLAGTPLDTGFGGVTFLKSSYVATTSLKLKIVDTAAAALGLQIEFSACQNNGPLPICGQNAGDVQQVSCVDSGVLTTLGGFSTHGDINVWIIDNDSGGIDGVTCDSVASQGTVYLVTA